jgi:radical SAM-linked protein
MAARFIDPVGDLGIKLLEVEKPARYSGGEYGSIARRCAVLRMAVAFPDLYEIGMSNQAFRIIYNVLNEIPGISCDRAFAPAPDFEALLEREGVPLYGLDTGIVLGDTDILCFSLGYELGVTGILTMLRASGIPLRSHGRDEKNPLVIMGGPCISNPLPFASFIDAFWIGEAEAGFFGLCEKFLDLKKTGAGRADLFALAAGHPSVWVSGKAGARRAVFSGFGQSPSRAAVFPVSSIRTVQHHGAVEIMRGCPNGCRFCQAGIWYRPMRQKQASHIAAEVEEFIKLGGYREISLSSLSSGDYQGINELVSLLNGRYSRRRVSFQLPSLRVSTFSLPLLEQISEVRKSGLTFAVETPLETRQLALNKKTSLEEVVSILTEAKRRGWRGAKFYFMIGLPSESLENEEEAIVDFVLEAALRSKGRFHVNAGTFVPKPHTPYERAVQLGEEEAWRKLRRIMSLKKNGHKISVHDPFTARIEGFIARGDERAGELFEQAFLRGARLDPWSEFFRRDIWKSLFAEQNLLVEQTLGEHHGTLPWAIIESGTDHLFLENEEQRSREMKITSRCIKNCTHPCGVCSEQAGILQNIIHDEVISCKLKTSGAKKQNPVPIYRTLFSFEKTGTAVFIPHLGVIEVFSMAFTRRGGEDGLNPLYTQGFNPHLKIEFAAPAAVGLVCRGEIACVDFETSVDPDFFQAVLDSALPAGLRVIRAKTFTVPHGAKKHSLASILYGFRYGSDLVPARDEKRRRLEKEHASFPVRDEVLARSAGGGFTDYFTAYEVFYGCPGL